MPRRASSVPRLSALVRQLASGTRRAARRTALAWRTTVSCSSMSGDSAGLVEGNRLRTRWNGASHSASRTYNTSGSALKRSRHSAEVTDASPPARRCLRALDIVSASVFARQAGVGEVG